MVKAKNKKVHTQMNNTIKSSDTQEVGVPRAIFIPHGNSLPFEERRVTLEQPVKIGRNVYRATPSPTNTIFECRVLSRHHATLYYEKGHFYLVDNQSSNGTFINNNRCSISSSQEPHEVFSGDIVMFGISVVENVPNSWMKQTFPPVIAQLKLFHPDGKEAKLSFNPTMTMPLDLKELCQLNNYVQEAISREASLEARLRALAACVEQTRAGAAAAWQVFVGEQRLLMRVRTLEAALAAGRTPQPQDLAQLLDDKRNYQEVAEAALRAAHEQRLVLEATLERRAREAAALQHHNRALQHHAHQAIADFQKLVSHWYERKISAARAAVAAAEEREALAKQNLPIAFAMENGSSSKLLVLSSEPAPPEPAESLEDAVRALPDYVKFMLPKHVLSKIGMKVISSEGKTAKEFELILQQNNIYDERLNEKRMESPPPPPPVPEDSATDDDKHNRIYLESSGVESSAAGDELPDNNANSTYSDGDNRDEDASELPSDMASMLRVIAGLNEEIRSLRARLHTEKDLTEKLRMARDELLAAAETPDNDFEDVASYRSTIADLQAQLTRSSATEEDNIAEIQRLSSSTSSLKKELELRPTKTDIDDLTAVIGRLQAELTAKNELLQQYQTNSPSAVTLREEKAVGTEDAHQHTLDVGRVAAEIDDLFRLEDDDDDDDDASESLATEVPTETEDKPEYVKIDDERRLEVTLANGSLHALEEELVRAKEGWADANRERAILAAQLLSLKQKPSITLSRLLVVVLPLLALALAMIVVPKMPQLS